MSNNLAKVTEPKKKNGAPIEYLLYAMALALLVGTFIRYYATRSAKIAIGELVLFALVVLASCLVSKEHSFMGTVRKSIMVSALVPGISFTFLGNVLSAMPGGVKNLQNTLISANGGYIPGPIEYILGMRCALFILLPCILFSVIGIKKLGLKIRKSCICLSAAAALIFALGFLATYTISIITFAVCALLFVVFVTVYEDIRLVVQGRTGNNRETRLLSLEIIEKLLLVIMLIEGIYLNANIMFY